MSITLRGGVTTVQSLGAPADKPLRDAIEREQVRKLADEKADVVKVFASESIRKGGGPTMPQEHGTYFDPNIDLVFRNYFENEEHFLGIGSYTAEGFAQMHAAVPKALDAFKKALATKNLKVVFGTDAVPGSHGRKDRIGSIAPGLAADLIAVRGNPLADIHAMEHVGFVMKGGRVDYASWKK